PRPADLVAPVPVEETPDVETSPTPEQAVTETPSDEPVVEQPPVEETAPEAAATELIPEQLDAPEVSTLAPATSPRPRARPAQRPDPAPEPAEEVAAETPVETPAEDPATDQATDQAAIDEALAAALAEETAAEEAATESPPTGAGGTPLGQALTAGELGDFRAQVQRQWNVGALSTEALAVSVTIAVTVGPDGVPDAGSVRLVAAGGGSDSAINAAYEAARSAILRAGRRGLALPLDKYETWRELEITFDASARQLR
ncbi:MAG: cell envelope biogenesis protein TolA, partial [Rhodobacteraceae bacterium]|nr:cell envelope biogenesis protein TolA [Paracoccaceae bacterium]